MPTIDADAHVVETDETWEYLAPSERAYKPGAVYERLETGELLKYWVIGDRKVGTPWPGGGARSDAITGTFIDNVPLDVKAKYMLDVDARVAHMDELGTDIQVLYPTLWVHPLTDRPEVETALCRSYNRWMADVHRRGAGRFRWAAVVPVSDIPEARRELRTARDNGAVAVNVPGLDYRNRLINDPDFFPLYQEASDLDMPVCIHSGTSSPDMDRIWGRPLCGYQRNKFVGLGAFHLLVMSDLPDRFPKLRWGIIELSAGWLPYLINDLRRRVERRGGRLEERILADNHIWVACQTNDDLEHVIEYVGDDRLVMGTDYGHADSSTEIHALQLLRRRESLDPASVSRILYDNPAELYALR